MGCVYPRKNKLWIRYKAADGKWTQQKTSLHVGDEKKARRILLDVEATRCRPPVAQRRVSCGGRRSHGFARGLWLPARRSRTVLPDVTAPKYTLEFFEDENGSEPVLEWLRRLTPSKRRAIGVAMFEILQYEGPHVVGTHFGKGLGGGVFEFRLDQDAAQILARKGKQARPETGETAKILLRMFCHAHGDRIVLLLSAYDKGERPSSRHQQAQIELARTRLKEWKVRQKR